ncbi:uncharacterized protein [Montipora capricornis]
MCCRDDTCELAMFSRRFQCFGVSCNEPKLCHRILDHLLIEDEKDFQLIQGSSGTRDFIRHTSQVTSPRCPQRFVPSFQVLLLGSSTSRAFNKMPEQSADPNHCNAQCCESRDCLLSFIEDDECYGVTGPQEARNMTMKHQGPRFGLQIAIIDRNKEVSRSLDDEDEDPDELGSDEDDNRNLDSRTVPTTLISQRQVGKDERRTHQLKANLRSQVLSSSPSKKISKKLAKRKDISRSAKGVLLSSITSSPKHSTKSHTQPLNMKGHVTSELSKPTGDTRHDKTASKAPKGRYSHDVSAKTKLHSTKRDENTLNHSDDIYKGSQRVMSSKANAKMKVVRPQIRKTVNGLRQGSRTIRARTKDKSVNNNVFITTRKGSKDFTDSKVRQKGNLKNSDHLPTKRGSSRRFSGLRMKEDPSKNVDSYEGHKELSRDIDFSGDSHFSGKSHPREIFRGAGAEDEGSSEDNEKVLSGHEEISGESDVWSGGDKDFSGDRNGESGYPSGDFHSQDKVNVILWQSKRPNSHRAAQNKMTKKVVHVSSQGLDFEDSKRRKVEKGRGQNNASALENKQIENNSIKTDLVEDLDNLGNDKDDNKVALKKTVKLPKNAAIADTAKQREKIGNIQSTMGNIERDKIDLAKDLNELGSDVNNSEIAAKKAASLPQTVSLSNSEKRHKGTLTDDEKSARKSKTTGYNLKKSMVDSYWSFGNRTSLISSKVVGLPQTSNTANSRKRDKNVQEKHPKFVIKKTNTANFKEHPVVFGSDKHSKRTPSSKGVRLTGKYNVLKAVKRERKTKKEDEQSITKGKTNEITHVDDPDELGSDGDDTVIRNVGDHVINTSSRKDMNLPRKASNVNSGILKETRPIQKQGKKYNTSTREGNVTGKVDLAKDLAELGTDGSDNERMKDELKKVKSGKHVDFSPKNGRQISSKRNDVSDAHNLRLKLRASNVNTPMIKSSFKPLKESQPSEGGVKANATATLSLSSLRDVLYNTTIKEGPGHHSNVRKQATQLVDMNEVTKNKTAKENHSKTHAKTILNETAHRVQTISNKRLAINAKSKNGEKELAASSGVKHKVTKTETKIILPPEPRNKSSNSLKNQILNAAKFHEIAGQSKKFLNAHEKYEIAGQSKKSLNVNGKKKHRKDGTLFPEISGHESANHVRSSKRTKKKSSKLQSTLDGIDDIMKYAHRKEDLRKHRPKGGNHHQQGARFLVNSTRLDVFEKLHSSHGNKSHLQESSPASFQKKVKHFQTTQRSSWRSTFRTTEREVALKKSKSTPHHVMFVPIVQNTNGNVGSAPLRKTNVSNDTVLSVKQHDKGKRLMAKNVFLSHFHKDGNRTDSVELSMKSGRRRHRGKHIDSIDVEDLGDADFDIMMSNDIPPKDLPKNIKMKLKEDKNSDKEGKDRRAKYKGGEMDTETETRYQQEKDGEGSKKKSNPSHKVKGKKVSKHYHDHRKSEHFGDDTDENHSTNEEEEGSKRKTQKSRNNNKGGRSKYRARNGMVERHQGKKHKHKKTRIMKKGGNGADERNNAKRVRHRNKHHDEVGNNKHHHKTRLKTYNSNKWVGKVIPGKVKATYEGEGYKGRGMHKTKKKKKKEQETRRKRKHHVKGQAKRKDDIQEKDAAKTHSRSHHKHFGPEDNNKKKEKHSRHHKQTLEEDENEKGEEQERSEEREDKRTDSNYKEAKTHNHGSHEDFGEGDDYISNAKHSRHQKRKEESEKKPSETFETSTDGDKEEKQERAEKRTDVVNYKLTETGRKRFHRQFHQKSSNGNEGKHGYHRNRKGRKTQTIKNEDKEKMPALDAVKSTEVNYEVETGRHRIFHDDDEKPHYDEHEQRHENEKTHKYYESNDDRVKSFKSGNDDRDYARDESKGFDDNERIPEEDDSDEKKERPNEKRKESRVVLGQDSESEDDDNEDKPTERSETRHHRQRHEYHREENGRNDGRVEISDDHRGDYSQLRHKSTYHHRYHHRRDSKLSHMHHHESYMESKESDQDSNEMIHDKRRNFKKSAFIYQRKEDEEQRSSPQHHNSARNREEHHKRREKGENLDYHREDNENEFRASERQRYSDYQHRHHNYEPRMENDKNEEKFEGRHDAGIVEHHREMKYEEREHFRKHHKIQEDAPSEESRQYDAEPSRRHHRIKEKTPTEESEDDDRDFTKEKEAYPVDEDSRDDDQDRWKFSENRGRDSQDSSQTKQRHHYGHDFFGDHSTPNLFERHPKYRKHRKFSSKYKDQEAWKHRQDFHEEGHDYDDSGGFFDASSSNHDEDSNSDRFYGGEGNHKRKKKKYRKKHWKHKHRNDRQSSEYWNYGSQNPYYYGYRYHKSRPRYDNRLPQPPLDFGWQTKHKSYDRWVPTSRDWYHGIQDWEQKPWGHSPNWQRFKENRPTRYPWAKYYNQNENSNIDSRDSIQPRPPSYFKDPLSYFRPTSPSSRQPSPSWGSFGGTNWRPFKNSGLGKQYWDWIQRTMSLPVPSNKSDSNSLLSPFKIQRRPQSDVSLPWGQMQPTGAQTSFAPPSSLLGISDVGNKTRFHPTVRRQYPATPPSSVLSPTNITLITNIMNKLSTPPPASRDQHENIIPLAAKNKSTVLPKINLTSSDQEQDRNRLNGFFKEEGAGKKSVIVRPANSSQVLSEKNSSLANPPQNVQRNSLLNTTMSPQTTKATTLTTAGHTSSVQNVTKGSQQAKSTTPSPTHSSPSPATTPSVPRFGDESQTDDVSETGKKHRKHRAPVCVAGKTTDDLTLRLGKRAGNFTNIGDVGDFGMCIKRCCQKPNCDVAFKSTETCFLVSCFSVESCQTSPALDDIFSPQMSFVNRHSQDSDDEIPGPDGNNEWNDKISPSGIHEVCEAEKALGILWKKTVAGYYSKHPCPRDAKGFVKRRCEADSRWLPPNFGDCVSNDYQSLYDKSRNLAIGADPSPLIRDLSQLTTQNIDNSLIFGGDLDRATDIMAAIVQHNGQTDSQDMTRQNVENFVRASSNLLDMTNQQEWFNIQKNKPGSADVLRSMEMFALQAARRLSREDMVEPTVTNNIVIKMDRKSPGDGGLTFPDFSNAKIDRWDARHDIIALPSSVFNQETSTASISFKTLPYLLPDSNVSAGVGPNSKVISTVMHPHPQGRIAPPVTVVLSHIKRRRGNPKCVFWDYTLNPHRGGAWSTRGCWLAFSNSSHSICQCSHLSNFAVLMDLSSGESLQKDQKRERTMALMWIGIPVLIVGVIGGLYMSFSWNRKSGISSTITRPSSSLNEKTGLLGQRVVTSQIREEFPASPSRDLYRALSPGYSPTGDLEWQDEFEFDVGSGDQRFKQMLLPKLQFLQNHLINEFYDIEKLEAKKRLLLEGHFEIQQKAKVVTGNLSQSELFSFEDTDTIQIKAHVSEEFSTEFPTQPSVDEQQIQPRTQIIFDNPILYGAENLSQKSKTSEKRLKLVRFSDDTSTGMNRTDEDKEHFRWLQTMERRVFAQHLSRWKANSHLNLSAE